MQGRRTLVNLITVILASVVLAIYALTELVAGAVLGSGYPLFIELDEAGGLIDGKQVTYRGVSVGSIADVDLQGDGVVVELDMDPEAQIPREVDVVILRQSAIGEQAIDFRPPAAESATTQFYGEMETIEPRSVIYPTKPEDLLEAASDVFAPVDDEAAGRLIAELADTVRGRSEDLQSILIDSASLSESIGDNGAEYDRLFAASRVVNAALAENRDVLAQLITDLADSADLIGEIRGDVDGLLDTVPPVLAQTTRLLERGDANLSCVVRDLANLNEYIATPPHLEDVGEALRTNAFFFDAFRIIGPTSDLGSPWLRVHFISEPVPPAQLYVPERPIPATLPGGACESLFGPGAGSAVQANHQLAVPEGEVVRPANDRRTAFAATGVEIVGDAEITLPSGSANVPVISPDEESDDAGAEGTDG